MSAPTPPPRVTPEVALYLERAREQLFREKFAASTTTTTTTMPPPPPAPIISGSCGGDLPPCYVMRRESGGSYTAFNPHGCSGRGCWGKWQFDVAWAGKLGLPADISTATPAQQDDAARQLWDGGKGCSNWDAC